LSASKSELEFHRKMAAKCFNDAWDFLGMKKRTRADDLRMLQLAHASRFHWGIVGTPANQAVGDWQISRVYAELRQPDLALRFARSSLLACKKKKLRDILPTAYEAVARAYAAGKDSRRASKFLTLARQRLDGLTIGREDREVYLGQILDTQRLIDGL